MAWKEPRAITAFGFTTLATATIGLSFGLISRGGQIHLSLRRSIILLLVFWLFMPVLGALPILGLDMHTGWIRAYSDAMSQLTTTGAKIAGDQTWPRSIEMWHAGLQWIGGYANIVLALLVLAPLNMTAPGVHRSAFLTIEKGNVAGRVGLIARAILLIYFGASVIIWVAMLATGTDAFSAALLMMGSISTGGYWPQTGIEGARIGLFGSWFALLAMSIGALGFALHWDVIKGRANYLKDSETVGMVLLVIVIAVLFFTLGHGIPSAIQNAVSLLTTTAVPMGADGHSYIPTPVIMAIVLVGGAAVSTAGGVKIIRFLILFRQTGADLAKLAHPSSTKPVQFRHITINQHELVGLWAYVLGYAGIISVLVIVLGVGGTEFGEAANIAIATVSNAGPAYTPDGAMAGDFSELSEPILFVLAMAMALGRIEILAAIAILSPEFWRN
ncbi:hypothetical protein MNBD_ALPHA06-1640 [hydrothermal vent metagenome]|uniref:Trk potassium uptake system protein TrkH n=1 Tax=hydrothermal vent metagenome TaxID=652676 RepID=A0A3B0SNK0_9ZZZZ